MDVSFILDPLNDAQREAVTAPEARLLVLAGAGSGKTRVLVHRIAWLVRVLGVAPHGLLAVTFTNKAAGEMRARTEALLDMPLGGMWIGTFHSLAHRLLRLHWREAGLEQNFQILDADDQLRTVRRLIRELELDDSRWQPKQVTGYINGRKDEGLRPDHLDDRGDPYTRNLIRLYREYEEHCRRVNAVDFAELLLRAHELLRDTPELLAHYRSRFRHLLVDEFQDTNAIQYGWLRLLTGDDGNLFMVGDDDQSIYGWRGARVENIQRFHHQYPDARVLRLEQNYRSTGHILGAANALIAHNRDRLGKELWTEGEEGEPIHLYAAFNDLDEARFVAERIRQWGEEGGSYAEAAILYRSNAQSRVLEEALLQAAIPYRIYGGLRFFERAEIRDVLAYLRLMANPNDDASFERVVNQPTRGIGDRTLTQIREEARLSGRSLWTAAHELTARQGLTARAANAVKGFFELVESLTPACEGLEFYEQVEQVIHLSGLWDHYDKEKGEARRNRLENLEELVTAARQFQHEDEEADLDLLSAFLTHAALEAGEAQGEHDRDCVQMMTLHSAKGLEFPLVFIAGLEEGLFPHQLSVDWPQSLEEERRLAYVGITRARRRLYLTFAEYRRLHGKDTYPMPSRFLREIPERHLFEVRVTGGGAALGVKEPSGPLREEGALDLGRHVRHAKFGDGVVTACEGQGAQARVQIHFESGEAKWLMLAYANLQML